MAVLFHKTVLVDFQMATTVTKNIVRIDQSYVADILIWDLPIDVEVFSYRGGEGGEKDPIEC